MSMWTDICLIVIKSEFIFSVDYATFNLVLYIQIMMTVTFLKVKNINRVATSK